jgi:tRNA threonylcarbamoyladenosine biosynthesis protein TsaE
MKKIINCKTALDTKNLGELIAKQLKVGMTITLSGDLGAGKTHFTKGIGKGLNISKKITSPTFTILKIYKGDLPLYHFDAYRLEGVSQQLGFDEYLDYDGITVIEWPEFMSEFDIEDYLEINITIDEDDSRNFELIAHGKEFEELLEVVS